jgi:hypothetical protein
MTSNETSSRSNAPPDPENPSTVLCKLFSDRVSEHLCQLRKKELDRKGAFSCEGCPTDAIMRRQRKTVQDGLDRFRDQSA